MPAITNERKQDAFQALILREVLLADGLQKDLRMAELSNWLGGFFAEPAAVAVASFTSMSTGQFLRLPEALTKQAIMNLFSGTTTLWAIRSFRSLVSQVTADAETTAHSHCRSALCYAVQGHFDEARTWLKSAAEAVPDLARPQFLRGLICGAEGDRDGALRELTAATKGRAKRTTLERIKEALRLTREDPSV